MNTAHPTKPINVAHLAAIRDVVFDIESPIGELDLCRSALYKLTDHVPEATVKTVMYWVLDDLHTAAVRASQAHDKLFDAVRNLSDALPPTPARPDPAVALAECYARKEDEHNACSHTDEETSAFIKCASGRR